MNYLENKELTQAVAEYQQSGQLSEKLHDQLADFVERIRLKYGKAIDKEDLRQYFFLRLIEVLPRLDCQDSGHIFNYLTTLVKRIIFYWHRQEVCATRCKKRYNWYALAFGLAQEEDHVASTQHWGKSPNK